MEELPLTQTQEVVYESQEIKLPWARLIACNSKYDSVDLYNEEYSLGRQPSCDINIKFSNVSKVHFVLTKDEDSGMAYIQDSSKNGTYVNKVKIRDRFLLGSGDIISLGEPKLNAYSFNYNQFKSEDTGFLPLDLRKKYLITEFLGKGSYGEVKLAYEKQTSQSFAIKKIIKSSQSNITALNHSSRIENEINILSRLRNDFIVDLKEMFETEKEVLLVFEYMKGGELNSRICSSAPLLEGEVKFIFYQIVLGVQYLHQNNITHRDIKPANILMTTQGRYPHVKITDFGLSKIMEEVSLMETVCGTLYYVAPEIVNNQNNKYCQQVDIWSLGVLLFQMLSKKLPIQGTDKQTIMLKILQAEIHWDSAIWKKISYQARDLVKKMLVVNPRRRIRIEDMLRHAWLQDIAMKERVHSIINHNKKYGNVDIYDDSEPPSKRFRFSENI